MDDAEARPWYRQFWPWFIMALPAASVVGGLFTLYIAGSEPSMVIDDYGRIAMATQQRAERSRQAEEFGLHAHLRFAVATDTADQSVTATLTQHAGTPEWVDGLVLRLVHPTRQELDRAVELSGSRGTYAARFVRPPGRYYVSLSDRAETWRLTGELATGQAGLELVAGDRGR